MGAYCVYIVPLQYRTITHPSRVYSINPNFKYPLPPLPSIKKFRRSCVLFDTKFIKDYENNHVVQISEMHSLIVLAKHDLPLLGVTNLRPFPIKHR